MVAAGVPVLVEEEAEVVVERPQLSEFSVRTRHGEVDAVHYMAGPVAVGSGEGKVDTGGSYSVVVHIV